MIDWNVKQPQTLHNRIEPVMPPILAQGQRQVPNTDFVGMPMMALGVLRQLCTAYGQERLWGIASSAQAGLWFNAVNGKAAVDNASNLIIGTTQLDQLAEMRAQGEIMIALLNEIRGELKELNGRRVQ